MLHIVIPLLGIVKSGGLRVLVELANGLVQKGHQVTFIAIGNGPIPFELKKNVAIFYLGDGAKNIMSRLWKIYINIPKNVDVFISNYFMSAYLGYFTALTKRVLHVYFVQDYEVDFFKSSTSISGRIKRFLAGTSYRMPAHIFTISRFILKRLPVSATSNIIIINDGVDTSVFKSSPVHKECGTIKLMAIARSERRKGLSDLINALNLLAQINHKFSVIFASNEKSLKIQANFDFEIVFPRSDIELALLYNSADIFVSTSHFEGFGLPPLESMACGTPVVTTDNGGINEYGKDKENCLIVPIGNVEAIFNAIKMLIENDDLRLKLAAGGLSTSSNFTWTIMVDKFEAELLRICGKSRM